MAIDLYQINDKTIMSEPQRQYKFVLLYCKTGLIKIDIDNQHYEIKERQFLTITPKQFYQFLEIENCEGYVLEFTYDFFCRDDKAVELIYHNGLYCHFGLNEIINIPDTVSFNKVEGYFNAIQNELDSKNFEYETSLHAVLKLLIIEASRYKIIQQQLPLYKPDAHFLQFLNLVRENFEKRLTIKEYAVQLNITEQKLNELTKKNTGETTQQLINDLIILEAKRLFNYENLNVKQVAYQLGFDDNHYFSRFFKKQTATRAKDHLRTLLTD
ncbi:helix-turn-helix domain-containing protein [Flavobacterium hydrophilum]|uniref:AraC family transcriptional regulator n=1 Tax=Flavobacterium hydrophilum TaxID=2211445 RepID=A0A2V4C430_9FLAO|nr:helix-turn-helix domain-containing protein [Flavobacterium hydrophilum]PXY46079.1 AraC family transcriptional regulator [Flavobacterium hydrophilum]